jgi:hypothetical protein
MGVIEDPFALFSNPAFLQTEGRKIGISYTDYISDIQGGCGVYVIPLGVGTFGGGISYMNYGNFIKTDPMGNELGNFTSQTLMPVVGYSIAIERFLIGVCSKFIYENIEKYTGMAFLGGAGCVYYPEMWKNLAIGVTVENVGVRIKKFNTTYEELPIRVRGGGNYLLFDGLARLSAEIEFPGREFILGIEWMPSKILTIRGGYYSWGADLETGADLDIFGGKSLGLGIKTKKLLVDYAVTPKVELGIVHRVSLTYVFPKEVKEIKEEPEKEIKEEVPKEEEKEEPEKGIKEEVPKEEEKGEPEKEIKEEEVPKEEIKEE